MNLGRCQAIAFVHMSNDEILEKQNICYIQNCSFRNCKAQAT